MLSELNNQLLASFLIINFCVNSIFLIGLSLLFIVLFCLVPTCLTGYCPKAEDLYPCECIEQFVTYIRCDTKQPFNLTSIFSKISKDPRAVQEKYEYIEIRNGKMVEISEYALGKLNFKRIEIDEGYFGLRKIHSNAFSYQAQNSITLNIKANYIISGPAPYSFYDLVNSFHKLEYLTYWSKIDSLEEKFGKNVNNSRGLTLRVDAIKGSPFSNMTKITRIKLNIGNLNRISKEAFKIGYFERKFVE